MHFYFLFSSWESKEKLNADIVKAYEAKEREARVKERETIRKEERAPQHKLKNKKKGSNIFIMADSPTQSLTDNYTNEEASLLNDTENDRENTRLEALKRRKIWMSRLSETLKDS